MTEAQIIALVQETIASSVGEQDVFPIVSYAGSATQKATVSLFRGGFIQSLPVGQDLRAKSVSGLANGTVIWITGILTKNDGGEGFYQYDSTSVAADNTGLVIPPDVGSGRWLRQFSGPVNVRWFGAKGDGTTDDTTPIQSAISAVNGGAYRGMVYIPAGSYKITSSLTLGAGGTGLSKPVLIFGDGQATQIINAAGSSNATFSFKGVSYFGLRDMILTGLSTNPNNGVQVAKDGSGNQCARFFFENIITETAGKGFLLDSTNTGVLRNCKHWPSSNGNGAPIAPVVNAGDIDHGIHMAGSFCNDISIYDFDCQPSPTYKAAMCAIKFDATLGNAIRVSGGSMEGSGVVVGTGRYSLNFVGVYFATIENCYCENADIRLSGCRYFTLNQVDQAGSGTLLLTGNSLSNTLLGGYYGTVQIDSGSVSNTLIDTGIYTALTDNATNTRLIGVGGASDLPDRGGFPIFVAATRATQTMTAGANTVVICTTEVIDTAGVYDPTTGRFTPAKQGYFRANFNGFLVSVAVDKEISLILFKNGSTVIRSITTSNAGTVSCQCAFEFYSAAGDYWQIAIRNGDASDRVLTEPNVTFSAIG
jgi:Pectate lyase superfamily protein